VGAARDPTTALIGESRRTRAMRVGIASGEVKPVSDLSTTLRRGVATRTNAFSLALIVLTVTGVAAMFALVGADTLWLAALGRIIASRGTIPAGVPFAMAPTGHWANTIVFAELIFHGLQAGLGDRGLMLAQLAAVALAIAVLARDALAGGASIQGTAAAVFVAALGALPDLSVIRVQLFSIVLFPLVVAVLRDEARRPSWRIWLVVPLLAAWSNLHGAALIGLGMTLAYLSIGRLRHEPGTAILVAVAAAVAICLTPAGIHTVAYYHGVLTNRAAQRGEGMWSPLSPTNPIDILLIVAAIALAARLRLIRAQPWELVVLLALAGLTVKTSRSGLWLLLFLVPLAARGFKPREVWNRLLPPLGTVGLVMLLFAVARGPAPGGASSQLVERAVALSHGGPVLAEDIFDEQVALAGGRIVVGNPIDAFSRKEQDRYLDWLGGKPTGVHVISPSVNVVLTSRSSPAQRLMSGDPAFRLTAEDRDALLFTRVQSGRPARPVAVAAATHRQDVTRPPTPHSSSPS
jgi:hypothetical protein